MNAAIVPVSPSALVVASTRAANSTTPVSSPPIVVCGCTFMGVYADVMQRADEMLPDRIVHIADLHMTPEGHVELPYGARFRLNFWARKQLASMLGIIRSQCHGV